MPETPDVVQARARYEKLAEVLGSAPDAKCEKVDAGGVPAEWVAAPGVVPNTTVTLINSNTVTLSSVTAGTIMAVSTQVCFSNVTWVN